MLLVILAAALTGADAATAQVTDPPAAQAHGELDESARTGDGDPTSPVVAAGAGVLVLVGAGAAAWARRRRLRAEPGGRHDVVASVASAATGPVYEIVWRHDGRRACFELARLDGGDDDGGFVMPRSRASTWRVEGRPPAVTSLRLDLAELSTLLRNSGWQPVGSGEAWYALRFRAPSRSSHPEPAGARRRS